MTYYTGPKTLRNKLNEWFAKQNHIKLPKNAISKLYVSVADAWTPAKLFPTGTEEGLFLDFSDISTLYTDQTFSTNISAIGDPVGGVLDKSQGLVLDDILGVAGTPENADSTPFGTIANGNEMTIVAQYGGMVFSRTLPAGLYKIRVSVQRVSGGPSSISLDYTNNLPNSPFFERGIFLNGSDSTDITFYKTFASSGVTGLALGCRNTSTLPITVRVVSFTVERVLGNHLIQATAASRPIWTRHPKSGVRNLLDDSANIVSVGTLTGATASGQTLTASAGVSAHRFLRSGIPTSGGTHIALSCTAVAGTNRYMQIANGASVTYFANFDLVSGTITKIGTGATAQMSASPLGGYDCSILVPIGNGTMIIQHLKTGNEAWGPNWDAVGTEAFDILTYQAVITTSHVPTQTRVSKYDVTEAGVADCYGLTFDGVDDYLETAAAVDFNETLQTSYCTGQKTYSAHVGYIFSFGTGIRPRISSTQENNRWRGGLEPTLTGGGTSDSAIDTAPGAAITSGLADTGGVANSHRLNGAEYGTLPVGTGTYDLNTKIQVGRSWGNAYFLDGTIYGLTLTDYILDAEQLAALEEWTAANTPEVTLA